MGLFDWLANLLGGGPTRPRDDIGGTLPARRPVPPGRGQIDPIRTPGFAPPKPPPAQQQRKEPKKLNLDAAQFTPISRRELLKDAKSLGTLWSSPWFGRRDLIPPETDPRTKLIDRALVSQGLLAPEDLVEIHEIGAEMDKIRPDLALASSQAAAVVRRSQDEHEELKRRKKAEAAERKRLHAEAVAKRKATDIVFLGRGVSGGLADRRANVEKLQACQLPLLAHPADVAQALKLAIPKLRWLAFHAQAAGVSHYVRFTVPKRSGGTRELAAPQPAIAACQTWILREILDKLPLPEAAHGFRKGRNTLSNAQPHAGRAVVVNADLKDFFPTVTFPRVKGVFQSMGYSPAAATILALLCTESPRRTVRYQGRTWHVATGPRALPQGACTSPALSNLVARNLDARLSAIAAKLGWTYTRYADDLTFSADGEAAGKAGYLLARIRHIAGDEGFAVNEEKTRVQRRNRAQEVTGIVVNQRPGVSRKEVRRLRAILHRARKEGLAAQNRTQDNRYESRLRGRIAYVCMVNPQQGRPLLEALKALES